MSTIKSSENTLASWIGEVCVATGVSNDANRLHLKLFFSNDKVNPKSESSSLASNEKLQSVLSNQKIYFLVLEFTSKETSYAVSIDQQQNEKSLNCTIEQIYEIWPQLQAQLKLLWICGHEPLQNDFLWEIMDYYGDLGERQKSKVLISTNLEVSESRIDWFIMKTHYIENLILHFKMKASDNNLDPSSSLNKVLKFGHSTSIFLPHTFIESEKFKQDFEIKFRPGFFKPI